MKEWLRDIVYTILAVLLFMVWAYRAVGAEGEQAEEQITRQGLVYHNAYKRNVVVTTPNSLGSGVIVETGIVLTNNHAIGEQTKVNGKLAYVLLVKEAWDLALLGAETAKVPKLRFDTNPELLERVFYIGNPKGHISLVSPGVVMWVAGNGDHLLTNTLGMAGFSGGGLYNLKGELVGLNEAMEGTDEHGYTLARHIPAQLVKAFLEEARKIITSRREK